MMIGTTKTEDQPTQGAQRAAFASEADRLGFDVFGLTSLDDVPDLGKLLDAFLADNRHGDMSWMADTADRRRHPTALWPNAHSAIVVGTNYGPTTDPLDILDKPNKAAISVYAQGKDYHDILKGKLKQLAGFVAKQTNSDVKVFVDTAPLMEKPLAASAGLGWQGKHTNLVSRAFGSWLFLGVILTTAKLDSDPPSKDQCGSCQACLDICPTNAFPAPYQLDARRCIAYLTIEYKGHIDEGFRKAIGNRVFGCDDCLAVCPWNKFAKTASEHRFSPRDATREPDISALLKLDDQTFRKQFAGTPVKRTGRDRVIRNALIAAGNSNDATLLPDVTALLTDTSPLVRAMAIWAANQLAPTDTIEALRQQHASRERDPAVQSEWRQTERK